MKMSLYCVLDRVANVCMVPFPATNHGSAIRGFGDGMQKNDTFKAHPQDYALLYIGSWDDNTGVIEGIEMPQTISSGADWANTQVLARPSVQTVTPSDENASQAPKQHLHPVPSRY